jgi:adenosylcobinamide kinase / adenosylcobinamide-phosphate guanylyltransferase
MSRLIFFTGGARSGKSRRAQARANEFKNVVYIATAKTLDDEMVSRVAQHRLSRPPHWQTIEEPLDLESAAIRARTLSPDAILLDCLTLWLSNHLLQQWSRGWTQHDEQRILQRLECGITALKNVSSRELIVVSNEVGCGIVPETHMVRSFRDLSGRANQAVAAMSDEVFLVAAGLPVRLK